MFQDVIDSDNPLEGLSENKKGFLQDLFARTAQGEEPMQRIWEAPHGIVTLRFSAQTGFTPTHQLTDDEIVLTNIEAEVFGKKDGQAALEMIKSLADDHRVAIGLNALPYDKCPMSEYKLIQWYKGQGFQKYRGSNNPMWREPA